MVTKFITDTYLSDLLSVHSCKIKHQKVACLK